MAPKITTAERSYALSHRTSYPRPNSPWPRGEVNACAPMLASLSLPFPVHPHRLPPTSRPSFDRPAVGEPLPCTHGSHRIGPGAGEQQPDPSIAKDIDLLLPFLRPPPSDLGRPVARPRPPPLRLRNRCARPHGCMPTPGPHGHAVIA
jgi:hypothetical protein